jgi:hypothetical protein
MLSNSELRFTKDQNGNVTGSSQSDSYRYGFQGQEMDDEIYSPGEFILLLRFSHNSSNKIHKHNCCCTLHKQPLPKKRVSPTEPRPQGV